ncbi:MAG: carbon storage regulator [Planctomycetaceae bacterium]|nr:carbon storage regulator [Planctomycetaceae bacterium]
MLVLSRTIGQEIVVDDAVRIRIVDIQGGKVRIGIAAPDDVDVDRLEIRQRKLEELVLPRGRAEPVLS